jgi:YD repeat-containing protein
MDLLRRVLAYLLVLGQVTWSIPVAAATPLAPKRGAEPPAVRGDAQAKAQDQKAQRRPPNRTAPQVKAPPLEPTFTTWPKDEEFFRARVFAEPLVPIGTTTPEENAALARALKAYLKGGGGEKTDDLVAFLEGRQLSPWRASLQLNLGIVYRRTGFFTRALHSWEEAWGIAKKATDPRGRAVAGRAAGELAQLNARLGNQDRLEALFAEADKRNIGGAAGEMIAGAKQGFWLMGNQPDRAFRCGPLALDRLLTRAQPGYKGDPRIHLYPSTAHGTTLLEIHNLANQLGLGYQMARRVDRASDVLVPALVHWEAGHFAALVEARGGRYLIQDPTFGEEIWVSQRAFDDETSGYMLVREGPLPQGWRAVEDTEAEHVWGKGSTENSDPQRQKCTDNTSGGMCTKGSRSCSSGQCCSEKGLAQYAFHTMLVNLHITDTPVGYSTPVGPSVHFAVTYNQREQFQPQVFTYSNVGPMWNFGWQSYIEDDPVTLSQPVNLYVRGGGQETYSNFDSQTQSYDFHTDSRAYVVRVSTSPLRYERHIADGSVDVYAQPDGALTFPRKVFLTESIDPQGRTVSFTYDENLRLVAVTDAIGQVTTLSYELQSDPLKVTKVTDPFGRFATLEYDASGRLETITDVVGMTSQFAYGSNDFVKSMTTPYGTTTFRAFDEGRRRWLEATDPLGETERLEYLNESSEGLAGDELSVVPYGLPMNEYPTGFWPGAASNLWYRNTFYWSKRAMALYPGDYTKAKLVHWLHTPGLTQTSGVIENEKEPLETMRTFYKYPNQGWQITGSHSTPSGIGHVMEDGSSQIREFEYNASGKTTKSTDPLGRETVYVYGTGSTPDGNQTTGTGLDLLQVKQKNGGSYDVLWSATYNSQHLPLTVTDAAGQTTTYTHNTAGQVLTVTTPERSGISEDRTTTYAYDNDGYLQSITGPATGATTSFTYDDFGRVQTVTSSDDDTVTYGYDDLDRLTKVTYPDSTYEETVYDKLDPVKRRDREGRWTETLYDAVRHVVATRWAGRRTTSGAAAARSTRSSTRTATRRPGTGMPRGGWSRRSGRTVKCSSTPTKTRRAGLKKRKTPTARPPSTPTTSTTPWRR